MLSGSLWCCPLQVARCNHRGVVSGRSYIECVFENDLVEMDAAATLAAAEANEHTLITAEVRRLQIAAHWADLHPGEAIPPPRLPGTQHPVRLAGTAPQPSVTSQPPSWAVCCASPTVLPPN